MPRSSETVAALASALAKAQAELLNPEKSLTATIRTGRPGDGERSFRYAPLSDSSATMPSQEPDRSAEAVRRALPDLRKLERYERRAAAQRERAVLEFSDRMKYMDNP
jgi:hypothetical protein